jgi:hypothetical protein
MWTVWCASAEGVEKRGQTPIFQGGAYEALLLAGAGIGGGTVGIAVGLYSTADSILDRWWLNRGAGPTGTPVTPA